MSNSLLTKTDRSIGYSDNINSLKD